MNQIKQYFTSIGPRRFIGMLIGNLIIGVGCAFFKWSSMGNDPFSACGMSLSALTGIPYGPFIALYNVAFFVIQLAFGRKYIGAGTLVNWFGLGYFTQGTYDLLIQLGEPQSFLSRLGIMFIGVLVICLGVSLYQTSDTGIAPYDSLSIIMHDRMHIPYFWCRMFTDSICALVCFLTGGLLGLGSLLSALGMGPVIHLYDEFVSQKVLRHRLGDQTISS